MSKQLFWTADLVNAFWNGVSGSRLDELSFAKLNGKKLLNLISPWLPAQGKILDFGAGSGFLVQQLLERGYRVAAFDPSGDRESVLTAKVGSSPNFLGLESGQDRNYDVVIFSEVIEHILAPDYDQVLTHMAGFVRPGGLLVITTPNQEDIERSMTYCPTCQHFFHPWQHVRTMVPNGLIEEFSQRGFAKAFLGLVDFSDDAASFEYGTITQALVETLSREMHADAGSNVRSAFTKPTLFQTIKRWLGVRSNRQAIDAQLDKFANSLAEAEQRLMRLSNPQSAAPRSNDADLVDLRIGHQNTIVYVGRKTAADKHVVPQ